MEGRSIDTFTGEGFVNGVPTTLYRQNVFDIEDRLVSSTSWSPEDPTKKRW